MDADIQQIIATGALPPSAAECIGPLLDGERFTAKEGHFWDFKREWPFSYSDEYFAAIARLICAFANTSGGLIIFGVHDETRTAGHNKVTPNFDKLQLAVKQLLTETVQLDIRRYNTGKKDAVDVLLVSPIDQQCLPARFKRDAGKFKADTIWVRQTHEVVQAEPRHVPLLYCRAPLGEPSEADEISLSGLLPPSPTTIKQFVGRLSTIDSIFRWLKRSDEPRTFLYGKGGSGKTTIAYEIAKVLKFSGSKLRTVDGDPFENVIFVSAKQNVLNTLDGKQSNFVGLDFENERELYESILTLGNWTTSSLKEYSLDSLKAEMKSFFDFSSNFIVIDDIDTLTTKGLEAGFDFLYGVLWKSKRRSKVLYTLRNAPTQSLANAIEVPGLQTGGEYEEFISVCAREFRVPEPPAEFRDSKLSTISEQRPLVLESIIALRRNSGNYDRAVQLFEQASGEDVRKYVFQREWDSLPKDNYGRYVLAILSLYGDSIAFGDIVALSRYDDGRVKDAIGVIREMFLTINDLGEETTYKLGALTKAFVADQCKQLDLYPTLKERVEKYKKSIYPENPILTRLRDRVERLVERGSRSGDVDMLKSAWNIVIDPSLSPKITEDPRFMALQGYVASKQIPSRLEDARHFFSNVFAMKFPPPIDHLKAWYIAERDSGYGFDNCIRIADFIASNKAYSELEQLEFLARKGTSLYKRARDDRFVDPSRAISNFTDALLINLTSYSRNERLRTSWVSKSEVWCTNTASMFFDFLIRNGQSDEFFKALSKATEIRGVILDPIEDPLVRAFTFLREQARTKVEIQKLKNKLSQARRELEKEALWQDQTSRKRTCAALESMIAYLNKVTDQGARSRL